MPIDRLLRETVSRRAFTQHVASAVVGGAIVASVPRPRLDAVLFDASAIRPSGSIDSVRQRTSWALHHPTPSCAR
jgi:hypothetical protein